MTFPKSRTNSRVAAIELTEHQVIAKTSRPRIPSDLPAGGKTRGLQHASQTRTRDVCGNLEGKRWFSFLSLALMEGDLRSQ